jgi:hypothetical protein
VAQLRGEYAVAQTYYTESLPVFQEVSNLRQVLVALEGLGSVLVVQAGDQSTRLVRATQVLGAAIALREQRDMVLNADEQTPHAEQAVAAARAGLGEAAFAAAWAAGQQLSLEQAFTLALQPTDA